MSYFRRVDRDLIMLLVFVVVVSLPSRYRSARFSGIGSMNGGCLLVAVGLVVECLALKVCVSLTWGSSKMRAQTSPYSGDRVVVIILCVV